MISDLKMDDLLKVISTHVEFFGYKVEIEDGILRAFHPTRPYFWAFPQVEGVFFRALFRATLTSVGDLDFLSFLNWANSQAVVSRFVGRGSTPPETLLSVESWFPNCYERSTFAAFFTQYLADIEMPARLDLSRVHRFFPPTK